MTGSMASKAVSGIKWGAVSTVASVLFQLLLTAVMARLLAPETFGLMAMATVALRLLTYFSQIGIGPALVQKQDLTPQDLSLALGLSLLISSAVALLVIALAPLASAFFRNDELTPVLRVLALNLVVMGLAAVSTAMLRRALRFKALALVETFSYILGYGCVGMACAYAGLGVWALVAATFGQSIFATLMAYAATRHSCRVSLKGDRKALLGYGGRHSVITFIEFLGANLDSAIIGRLLGEAALGLYNRALLLTNLPTEKVAGILSRVLFPVLSAAQHNREKVGATFMLGILFIGFIGGTVSLGISAAAEPIVLALLGPKWVENVPVIQVLALSVPFMFMSNVAGVVCDSLALLNRKLWIQSSATVLLGLGMWAVHSHGVVAIAGVIVLVEALRFIAYLLYLRGEVTVGAADLARILTASGLSSALVYLAIQSVEMMAHAYGPALRLTLATLFGAMAFALGAVATLRFVNSSAASQLAAQHIPMYRRLAERLCP